MSKILGGGHCQIRFESRGKLSIIQRYQRLKSKNPCRCARNRQKVGRYLFRGLRKCDQEAAQRDNDHKPPDKLAQYAW